VKLSETQIEALYALRDEGPLGDFAAAFYIGKSRNVTLRSLERNGFARWFPTPEHWKITPDGRAWLNDEDARRALAEHQAKTDAAVEAYRKTP
jgi:hypothetical protein